MCKWPLVAAATFKLLLFSVGTNAAFIQYDFNFSTGGSGGFLFDEDVPRITWMTLDFGEFGSAGPNELLSNSVIEYFGHPPSSTILKDNFPLLLFGGSAYAVRLMVDGTFCVRPDGNLCGLGAPDLLTGTYSISPVPVPAAAWLFGSAVLMLGVAKRRYERKKPALGERGVTPLISVLCAKLPNISPHRLEDGSLVVST